MKMTKLEDIPKRDFYQVPEGFFEALPGQIRSRMDERSSVWFRRPQFKLAYSAMLILLIPVLAILGVNYSNSGLQNELSAIGKEELVEYLEAEISLLDITSGLSENENIFDDIMQETLHFEDDGIEEQLLLDLERYSDETL